MSTVEQSHVGERPAGTYSAYYRDKCRCAKCRAYQTSRVAANRADRLAAGRINHGTVSGYDAGCHCDACSATRAARYELERRP